ncbi:MAG: lysophospholipid acyltransferase family protein [Rhodothermales bacterium]
MIQSAWTWFAVSILIVAWLPLLAVVRLFDRDPAHYRTGWWFRRLGCMLTKVNPTWHITISGYDVSEPRRPFVVVSNHQSLADIPVISCLPWEMKWVAKAELFHIPIVGWLMRLAGDIVLDRGDSRSGARALMTARQYLRARCSVMFFPEGTRSRHGGLRSFSEGPFRLAIKEQVPVLPLVIDGTRDALPKHSWMFGGSTQVRLTVLPPVPTDGLTGSDAASLTDTVRKRIAEQLDEWSGENASSSHDGT